MRPNKSQQGKGGHRDAAHTRRQVADGDYAAVLIDRDFRAAAPHDTVFKESKGIGKWRAPAGNVGSLAAKLVASLIHLQKLAICDRSLDIIRGGRDCLDTVAVQQHSEGNPAATTRELKAITPTPHTARKVPLLPVFLADFLAEEVVLREVTV